MARRAAAISAESRATSGAWTVLGPSATAASTKARLVCDFDPGRATVAPTVAWARGAAQVVAKAGDVTDISLPDAITEFGGHEPPAVSMIAGRRTTLAVMCGRYVSVQADADLLAEFDAIDASNDVSAAIGYNVAPTDAVRAIVNRRRRGADGQPSGPPVRQLRVMSWGLVPSWAKDRSGAAPNDQRARGVSGRQTCVQACVRRPSLSDSRRRLVRVAT